MAGKPYLTCLSSRRKRFFDSEGEVSRFCGLQGQVHQPLALSLSESNIDAGAVGCEAFFFGHETNIKGIGCEGLVIVGDDG